MFVQYSIAVTTNIQAPKYNNSVNENTKPIKKTINPIKKKSI